MDKRNEVNAQNGLDPDLAELLDIEEAEPVAEPAPAPEADHSGSRTFIPCSPRKGRRRRRPRSVDPTKARFPTIIEIQEEPKPFFQDKDFYKKVLTGEGDEGNRVHELLGKYMKAEDPEEKSKCRAQLISAFWELGSRIAYRAGVGLIMPKRLLLRFGILSPGFLTPELRDMVSRIIYENKTGEPVWYVDEWLERISKGLVRPSTADEVKHEGQGHGPEDPRRSGEEEGAAGQRVHDPQGKDLAARRTGNACFAARWTYSPATSATRTTAASRPASTRHRSRRS